ncbi:hypothetical protein AOL_s00043g784 [Orbilia oligospora ATCC 24927]|uniref:Extracellular membrane protein CFEM domain-containing protein n=1 Tax=Arthrobotrys oligospora (strain ATCC 24927 / CBS 115.81 / DSM 1491) TaxID=756982 RepID=G1X510_ARTOA|nr:hypothetical protein AOL_s00043g784 [Orbilia oligospora ATCC 24927]EGX51765.1 hypothetical protein AOL_s00043g784 [Orbilia oligospora ATCC 24927]
MRFSTLAFAAIAALPSAISAFSLYDISSDLGDANDKCASQYSIPLMSCGFLPGKCSEACQEQLQSLEKTLQGVCKDAKKPQNLLLAALNDGLVPALCSNAASGGSSGGGSGGSDDAPSTTPTFMSGPGKTPSPSVAQLSFSGVLEATSASEDQSEPTGLVIDTSVPESSVTQTVAFPENTYASTTLRTSSAAASTTGPSSNNNGGTNGSPFSSQDDAPSSGAVVRVSAFGVAIGVFALIANIA